MKLSRESFAGAFAFYARRALVWVYGERSKTRLGSVDIVADFAAGDGTENLGNGAG